jgi:hypothetical protein
VERAVVGATEKKRKKAVRTSRAAVVPAAKPDFDGAAFLRSVGAGRSMARYRANENVFRPGDPANAVFYILKRVGTTRSRINFFMDRFRKLGFIECNGELKLHSSLLNIVVHD